MVERPSVCPTIQLQQRRAAGLLLSVVRAAINTSSLNKGSNEII